MSRKPSSCRHADAISDQFTRQAKGFAAAPQLHNDAVLALLTSAAVPLPTDRMIDVACGPGTVVAAFARQVAHVVGIDMTAAMLTEAQSLARERELQNVAWLKGSAYELPFREESFDIVVSRFAFHHLQNPPAAFQEMCRVARGGARIMLCDVFASDDHVKAEALNAIERWRDPSTVACRTVDYLRTLFSDAGLPQPSMTSFEVPYLAHELVARSFPADDDRAGLLALIEASVGGDLMNAYVAADGIHIAFQAAILTATKI